MTATTHFANPALKQGILFGIIFGVVGIVFALFSTLTNIEYETWRTLFNIKGVAMFALCGVAGLRVIVQSGTLRQAMLAGIVAGVVGTLIYTLAQWIIPYALFDSIIQYPYLHKDFTYTGMSDIKVYLASEKGYRGIVGMTFGLLPFSVPFATILGAIMGVFGGYLYKGWTRIRMQAA